MKSPFKFLDSYTLADKDVFFGRDTEIEDLYQLVFKTPLSLVYGLSGTGKTSLIQCGLAGKFDGPDWYPFWIRRNEDLNHSFKRELDAAIREDMSDKTVVDKVGYLFRYYLRPIYLIFDQFEELFIMGPPEEQIAFMESIQQLLAAELPCRIILVMREEYLGQLYQFEKYVPTLYDFRLRVERMNNAKVEGVILDSCEKFNISLEEPVKERCQQMIDKISAGKSGIQLPYLQVYLDMLYRMDYKKTYGKSEVSEDLPPLTFTQKEIKDFGEIDDVLGKFIHRQEEDIQQHLAEKFPTIQAKSVRKVMDAFATSSGTKRPMGYKMEEDNIIFDETYQAFFPDLPKEVLTQCINLLEKSRILRSSETSFELAHDSLASLIDDSRSEEQKKLNEIKNRISHAFQEFEKTGEYMSPRALFSIEGYVRKLVLEDHLKEFVENSREAAKKKEEEKQKELEKERQLRKEATQAKDDALKAKDDALKARNKAGILTLISTVVGIAAVSLAGIATNKSSEAYVAIGKNHMQSENYQAAGIEFKNAKTWGLLKFNSDGFNNLIKSSHEQDSLKYVYDSLMEVGSNLQDKGAGFYSEAIQQFEAAKALPYIAGGEAESKITLLNNLMKQAVKDYEAKGDAFKNAYGYDEALYAYGIVKDLVEEDSLIQIKIDEITPLANAQNE